MASSDAFALRQSGLNEFLFAPVGTEANGMTLSLVSVFARLGNDPWLEAGKLARLPKSEAIESLARLIAGMPTSIYASRRNGARRSPDHAATHAIRRIRRIPSTPALGHEDWPLCMYRGRANDRVACAGLRSRCLQGI